MKVSTQKQIEKALKVLVGIPVWSAGRAGDLEWFQFGKQRTLIDSRQKSKEVGQYALHVQCAWRIIGPTGIIVASRDRFYPAGDPEQYTEDFEWDRPGANRCDERVLQFFEKHKPSLLIVERIQADAVGSLRLVLSGGFAIEVFPDDSLKGEYWRLFRPGERKGEFVFTGQGVEK